MSVEQNDPRLAAAIDLFNRHEFFACHDVLEEMWSETVSDEKQFLKGLIHAAVSLFHFTEGNLGGARKMHDSAVRYLSPYQPSCLGIEVSEFLIQFSHCFEPLLGAHDVYPNGIQADEALIPKLSKPTLNQSE